MEIMKSFKEMSELLRDSKPLALFVGSAISHAYPSCLPLFNKNELIGEFVRSLSDVKSVPPSSKRSESAEMVLSHSSSELLKSKNFYLNIGTTPPEVVLAAIQSIVDWKGISIVRDLVVPQYGISEDRRFNGNHESIARLLVEKKLTCVFTTNYDGLLEAALKSLPSHYLIVDDELFEDWSVERILSTRIPVIFKLHGNACGNKPDSIIAIMKQLGRGLAKPKERLLEKCLTSFNFITVGYSMNDWDVRSLVEKHDLNLYKVERKYFDLDRTYTNIFIKLIGECGLPTPTRPVQSPAPNQIDYSGLSKFVGMLDLPTRLSVLASIYLYSGLGRTAIRLSSNAFTLDTQNPKFKLQFAQALTTSYEWHEASKIYEEILESPSTPLGLKARASSELAFCRQQIGDFVHAEKYHDQAIQLYEESKVFPVKNKYDADEEGEAICEQAAFMILAGERIRKQPEGVVKLKQGLSELEKLEKRHPWTDPILLSNIYIEKGSAYQALGDFEEAINALTTGANIARTFKRREREAVAYFKLATALYLRPTKNPRYDPIATISDRRWCKSVGRFYYRALQGRDWQLLLEGFTLIICPFLNIFGIRLYWFLKTRVSKVVKGRLGVKPSI